MRELPGAGHAENDELDGHPPDYAPVGGLGLVSEFGFSFLGQGVSATVCLGVSSAILLCDSCAKKS